MLAVKSDLPLQLATYHNLGPAELELLRMGCDDDDSLSSYMQLLMSKSDMISQGSYSLRDHPMLIDL